MQRRIISIDVTVHSEFHKVDLVHTVSVLFNNELGDYKKDSICGFNVPRKMFERARNIFQSNENYIGNLLREAKSNAKWFRQKKFNKVSRTWKDDYIDDIYTVEIKVY